MQETVLITGGSGLVGSQLTKLLLSKGYNVIHISRKASSDGIVPVYQWDLARNGWDAEAIKGVDYIIHLAGANVAEGRWSVKRKQQIIDTRIVGSKLVAEMVEASQGNIKGVVSASAVGYYGIVQKDTPAVETDEPGTDFLADVCVKWEETIIKCSTKVGVLRTGVVLAKNGGAVPKMLAPIKLGVGAPLGMGNQPMPWIHIDDLCHMYLYVMEEGLVGTFNAVAPELASNKSLTLALGKAINKRIWIPNVPAFVLKLILGKMSTMLLTGVDVSPQKIVNAGFKFSCASLSTAIAQVLK